MIIRSVRLQNIKSYGEGPEGKGVTVRFEPGTNCIAGKNGHGKSTIIEGLGYALFLTSPIYEENFNLATYLVRSGKKAGEIDVEFEFNDRSYRVERGLGGQSKRRSKVILLSDGSTEAEGDQQVANYLCSLFGFRDAAQFSELFSKLVGVKQGRLAWPFDATPTDAKRHFEPLLDVQIFRECFDQLRPVYSRFEALKQERELELAAIKERISHRADSAENVKVCQTQLVVRTKAVEDLQRARQAADQERKAQEKQEIDHRDAETALNASRQALALATQTKEQDFKRVQESLAAEATVKTTFDAHEAYKKADRATRELLAKQNQKAELEQRRSSATHSRTDAEAKASAAEAQVRIFTQQSNAKKAAGEDLRAKAAALQATLKSTKAEFDRSATDTQLARKAWEASAHWRDQAQAQISANSQLLACIRADWKSLASWNSEKLKQARAAEHQADNALKSQADRLAEARKVRETLTDQLKQIGGGVCPFLKEKCRQFDPAKVQSDVSQHEKEIERLTRAHSAAADTYQQVRTHVEKLAKEEARLLPLKSAVDQNVATLIKSHNNLVGPATREHFRVLSDYLPQDAADAARLALLAAAGKDFYDESGNTLNLGVLENLSQAETGFQSQAAAALKAMAQPLESKIKSFEKDRDERLRAENDLKHHQDQRTKLDQEARELVHLIEAQIKIRNAAREAAETSSKVIAELDEKLKAYANLSADLETQGKLRDENAPGHEQFLGARPLAEKFTPHQSALEQSALAEKRANELALQKHAVADKAKAGFDPAALARARVTYEDISGKFAAETAQLKATQKALDAEKQRFAEWQQAISEQKEKLLARSRIEACMDVTQKARNILLKTAPLVAQHVCERISGLAQRIFNRISTEPVELEWHAERYSLRIGPGERRFAMLSGGEQTKLALAMTLAMIQEFSGLRLCIFDEPTYGVDTDSREKLADAILQLQGLTENRLDQVLLVSHDDAFEGKIENVVTIRKTANEGSLVANSG